MTEVKWIKITTTMFDDEKIRLIESMPEADSILIIWIKLLTLAGRTNVNGYIFLTESIPYTDDMLVTLFNRPVSTVKLALETFKRFGMIEYDNKSFLHITNWDKYQNVKGLDKIREQAKIRQQKYRGKQKELTENSNVTVTLHNALDKTKSKKENKNIINSDYEQEVFNYWNEQGIVKHQKITNNLNIAIKSALRMYPVEIIKQAIERYGIMYNDPGYEYCDYKWTLERFLDDDKGVASFFNDGQKWLSYQNSKQIKARPIRPGYDECGDPIPGALDQTPI